MATSNTAPIAKKSCSPSTTRRAFVTAAVSFLGTDLVAKSRIPAMYSNIGWVNAGGLMAYAPDTVDQARRAASYVVRILKGAKPGDLPIEQPTKFELAINMKTAKALGITIPPVVMVQATRVIE